MIFNFIPGKNKQFCFYSKYRGNIILQLRVDYLLKPQWLFLSPLMRKEAKNLGRLNPNGFYLKNFKCGGVIYSSKIKILSHTF